jgi:mono/diheme cytochrome c family protein
MRTVVIGWMGFALFVALESPAAGQEAVEKGKQLYGAQRCSMCHAVAGQGNAKGPLDTVGKKYSAAELKQWLVAPAEMAAKHNATRKPAMRDFAKLPAADLDTLVAYLQTLGK